MKNNKISLAEVARAAGVSKMTASRVIRDEGGFSEKTRHKVMAEVDRLGYLPNRLATVFAGDKKSTFVGVSIPELGNEIFAQLLEGIDRKLVAFAHQTVLGMTEHALDQEEAWIETVLSWQPAGLIVTGRSHSPRAMQLLKGAGIPIVEIWDFNSNPLDMCVGLNHFDSGYSMGRYLGELGYTKFGYVGTSHDTANAASSRLAGFTKAAEDAGGTVKKKLLLKDVPGFYTGLYGTEQLLAAHKDVDVIFYQNDNMAVGGYEYCRRQGLEIPRDIGIAGWGDLPIASIQPYRLTSIAVPHLRIGQIAAEMLLAQVNQHPIKRTRDVGFKLIPGSTCRMQLKTDIDEDIDHSKT
ncbi:MULTISPECIES: LacI family DNA-binding transcriptional regulator [Pacificibacter]|uniref:LacI family DNA-binding transcriptional regulator n=1 Tax=Pacificibacter TaxID=1042323 RepID=UPI001C09889F|nr:MULTISPECIES: LacI family DNA-binding transcriptional regulator [Pacificibacter]MBU2937551.1 LacI family DNA-binding transcriptional regulator [Pacificibacter marinus]MDO6616681.1 LacI family DNA-binding transcriptional regulator [Pacificibacter sp. 1_MG-2023]